MGFIGGTDTLGLGGTRLMLRVLFSFQMMNIDKSIISAPDIITLTVRVISNVANLINT